MTFVWAALYRVCLAASRADVWTSQRWSNAATYCKARARVNDQPQGSI